MTGRGAQRKGAAGEIEVAARLSQMFGVPVKRMATAYLPGIVAPDVFGLAGIHCEVKRVQRLNLCAALRQARRDADGKAALVLHRRNHERWLATMLLEDLPELGRALQKVLPEHEHGQTLDSEAPENRLDQIGQSDKGSTP